jgi:hypothetical protein
LNNITEELSEQQLLDCADSSFGNQGCNGGWMSNAFQYTISKKLVLRSSYPYTTKKGKCSVNGKSTVKGTVKSYVVLSGPNNLKKALREIGPVAVAVDATNFHLYKSGIFNDCTQNINHVSKYCFFYT